MAGDYIPHKDSTLVGYSNNFQNGIAGTNAAALGLSPSQSSNFASLNLAWTNSYAAIEAKGTRTPNLILTKNQCKKAMVSDLRTLAQIIQKNPAVTDQQRNLLGLTVSSGPTPVPPPTSYPAIEIKSAIGRTITLKLHNSEGTGARPAGAKSAQLYSFVGATPPDNQYEWNFEGNCTRQIVKCTVPNSVSNGAQIWFTGCWLNERSQPGPNTPPVTCNIPGGSVSKSA